MPIIYAFLFPKEMEVPPTEVNLKQLTKLSEEKFKEIYIRIYGSSKGYSPEANSIWDKYLGSHLVLKRNGIIYTVADNPSLINGLKEGYNDILSFAKKYLSDFDLQPELKLDFYEVPWTDLSPEEYLKKKIEDIEKFAKLIGAEIVPLYKHNKDKDDQLFVSLIPKAELKTMEKS